jgi:hypothetical protein
MSEKERQLNHGATQPSILLSGRPVTPAPSIPNCGSLLRCSRAADRVLDGVHASCMPEMSRFSDSRASASYSGLPGFPAVLS